MYNFLVSFGRLSLVLLPLILMGFVSVFFFDTNYLQAMDPDSKEEIMFEIPNNAKIEDVGEKLKLAGLIRNSGAVGFYAKKQGVSSFPAGEFSLTKSLSPKQIISSIVDGKKVVRKLVIPANSNLRSIKELIVKEGIASKEAIEKELKNQILLVKLSVPSSSFEGLILDGSYTYSKPTSTKKLITDLVKQSREKLGLQISSWEQRAKILGYQPHDILKIASMVEIEGKTKEEKEKLATYFHNRLRLGFNLESEKTLAYKHPGLKLPLSSGDKQIGDDFNTFKKKGLPPSPICSPSIDAIRAVLYPPDLNHIYYFRSADGSLVFSDTLTEHKSKLPTVIS